MGWGFPPDIDGGLDIHVYNLFNQLKQAENIEVALALPEERAPEKENIIPVASSSGGIRWRAMKMSSHIAEIAENYDIIHTHDWFGAEAGFKAKKYSGCRWVSTFHSISSDRTRGESQNGLEQVALQHSDITIAVSRKLSNKIRETYGHEPEVVRNGFSQPGSSGKDIKKQLGIQNEMVFFVGRHAEQKGIEHLLYGFKKFLEDEGKKGNSCHWR
ncbi:MAG: glycosyltransferase [Candidatus Nanosalina sp. J07AB43]|nr:MAG: glycosyltransferase [Candidatus Nanosalina sp. J07AB43]